MEIYTKVEYEDFEVLGLDTDLSVIQWDAKNKTPYNCGESLEEWGVDNLRPHERARVGLDKLSPPLVEPPVLSLLVELIHLVLAYLLALSLRYSFGAVETVADYLVEYAFRQWGGGSWGVLPRWHFPSWWVVKANEEGTFPSWYAGIFYRAGCKLINQVPHTYWETN